MAHIDDLVEPRPKQIARTPAQASSAASRFLRVITTAKESRPAIRQNHNKAFCRKTACDPHLLPI
jgi:hypothetical protein